MLAPPGTPFGEQMSQEVALGLQMGFQRATSWAHGAPQFTKIASKSIEEAPRMDFDLILH